MVALRLKNFGGMIPAVDARLLPDNMAETAENTWVYTGSVEGLRTQRELYTLVNPLTRKVYRIPKLYADKEHIYDSYWLEFQNPDVDVVRSPLASDTYERYYWAYSQTYSNDPPRYNTKARIASGASPYLLGIPAPTVAPRVSRQNGQYTFNAATGIYTYVGGSNSKLYDGMNYALDPNSLNNPPRITTNPYAGRIPAPGTYTSKGNRAELRYGTTVSGNRIYISDSGTVTQGLPTQNVGSQPYTGVGVQESRAYVYTWVSAYGEEGPPSPATVFNGWSGDPWVISLTAPDSSVTTNRNLSKVRIYRTVTSVAGSATYFFVAELDVSQTTYTDVISSDTVTGNNILETTFWTPPPSDLTGMVSMPNGIIAGWRSNEVWFCEPYRPHAWPVSYALAFEYPVVGLGVIGQTLIVCTTGYPYAVSGVSPATMTVSRLATAEPCLSRASIVSTQNGVLYASPNGLALAVAGQVQIVTRNLVTKDHWLDMLYVETLRASLLNGAYYCWGSVRPGCFESTSFNTAAFLQLDASGAYSGALIELQNERVAYTKLSTTNMMYNVWTDAWTGEVLTLHDDKVYWLDISRDRPHDPFKWKSKIFEMPNKRNLEAMRVWFTTFDDTPTLNPVPVVSPTTLQSNMYGIARVYADGVLKFSREIRSDGEFMRLPSGFKATYWQIEIEARVQINSIEISTSAKELMNV